MLNMLFETKTNEDSYVTKQEKYIGSTLSLLSPSSSPSTTTPASLILCAKDMNYTKSIQPHWDSWFDLIEPLISQTPFLFAVGKVQGNPNWSLHLHHHISYPH